MFGVVFGRPHAVTFSHAPKFQIMRFSFWPNSANPWSEILDVSQHAERTGRDGVWLADHFMPLGDDTSGPMQECFTALAGLAASVPRVRIGSIVAGNTYRNPAVLAKQAATIDQIAGGRFVLGIGAGWQENEHVAYGIEFSTVKGRLDRLEEACAIITSLFANDNTNYDGQYYKTNDAPLVPKPVQPHMPLLVGGGGEKRTMRIAASTPTSGTCGETRTCSPRGCRARSPKMKLVAPRPFTTARSLACT
jgi:alkanesulfonate monooxygenase SsuD/methylene tetrahydromethanopterin reductase-like flavin-dependent oxidoreductase (luciferase family)